MIGQEGDGFLPIAEAAKVQGVSEDEVLDMLHRGLLECHVEHGFLAVRPAVVSVTVGMASMPIER